MSIDYKKAELLRQEWGGKPCSHPAFAKERYGGVTCGGYVEPLTGDWICTQCGEVFTELEMREINSNKSRT